MNECMNKWMNGWMDAQHKGMIVFATANKIMIHIETISGMEILPLQKALQC